MSEIAKCPCCGWVNDHDNLYKTFACTQCLFICSISDFHRIAAAMELAKLTVQMKTCRAYCPERAFLYAQDRVLEVFNEQVTEDDKSKNIMVYLNGKDKPAFRCHCGCNVFHHPTDIPKEKSQHTYICNACDTQYIGE